MTPTPSRIIRPPGPVCGWALLTVTIFDCVPLSSTPMRIQIILRLSTWLSLKKSSLTNSLFYQFIFVSIFVLFKNSKSKTPIEWIEEEKNLFWLVAFLTAGSYELFIKKQFKMICRFFLQSSVCNQLLEFKFKGFLLEGICLWHVGGLKKLAFDAPSKRTCTFTILSSVGKRETVSKFA